MMHTNNASVHAEATGFHDVLVKHLQHTKTQRVMFLDFLANNSPNTVAEQLHSAYARTPLVDPFNTAQCSRYNSLLG
ncbi:hypothetical protein ACHAQI_011025 [Fusarium lateritium]